MGDCGMSFPIENTSTLDLDDFKNTVVPQMKANGDLPQVAHFAEQAFGISPTDPDRETKLAQGLLRVAKLYEAGALVESLDVA